MILMLNIMLTAFGFFLYVLTVVMPRFKMVYLDWIGLIILVVPWILDLYFMKNEGTLEQTDRQKKWTTIVDFINRERDVHTVVANRPYHALSFLQARGMGLVENKGKDSVLKKGSKKYVLALENCEHTPDPDMMIASEILYELGVHNSYTLKKLLTGQFLDAGDFKLMGQILVNMQNYEYNHGGHKLVSEWKDYEGKNIDFKPPIKKSNMGAIEKNVDDLVNKIKTKYERGGLPYEKK
ncbi:MAG: hypothetical protein KGY65_07080 [Candidatus Thermoplasmatota archaeon]|nr:hypothetical protein [Candidatus Thermoplasmatota archaeon]MBS3802493.1 hypothetical protein [Candidatus Thermoplasmatota archaeon]